MKELSHVAPAELRRIVWEVVDALFHAENEQGNVIWDPRREVRNAVDFREAISGIVVRNDLRPDQAMTAPPINSLAAGLTSPRPAALVETCRKIMHARDYHAEHGRYPEGAEGVAIGDRQVDDWAADLVEAALEAARPASTMRTHYSYRYLQAESRQPLHACPDCGADLTKPGGVCVDIAAGGDEFVIYTRLEVCGVLVDADDLVWNGYHSATGCAVCHTSFSEMDGIIELQRQHHYHADEENVQETETGT